MLRGPFHPFRFGGAEPQKFYILIHYVLICKLFKEDIFLQDESFSILFIMACLEEVNRAGLVSQLPSIFVPELRGKYIMNWTDPIEMLVQMGRV